MSNSALTFMCCITLFPVSKSSKSTEKRCFSAFLRDNLHTYSIQDAWVVQARRQPDNHHLRPQCFRLNNFVAFDQNLNLTSHWRQMVFFYVCGLYSCLLSIPPCPLILRIVVVAVTPIKRTSAPRLPFSPNGWLKKIIVRADIDIALPFWLWLKSIL